MIFGAEMPPCKFLSDCDHLSHDCVVDGNPSHRIMITFEIDYELRETRSLPGNEICSPAIPPHFRDGTSLKISKLSLLKVWNFNSHPPPDDLYKPELDKIQVFRV